MDINDKLDWNQLGDVYETSKELDEHFRLALEMYSQVGRAQSRKNLLHEYQKSVVDTHSAMNYIINSSETNLPTSRATLVSSIFATLWDTHHMSKYWLNAVGDLTSKDFIAKSLKWQIWVQKLKLITQTLPESVVFCYLSPNGPTLTESDRNGLRLKVAFLDDFLDKMHRPESSVEGLGRRKIHFGTEINRIM